MMGGIVKGRGLVGGGVIVLHKDIQKKGSPCQGLSQRGASDGWGSEEYGIGDLLL